MADNKDIVSGIFGLTPELYQQAQLQRDIKAQTEAATMAAQPGTMLNPSLAPLYAEAAQQGQILGRGAKAVGGLLGVEDPELKMIRDIQEMRSQFDVSTPAGLRKFSQALSARGYTKFAMEAAKEADNREKVVEETNIKKKEGEVYGREYKEIGFDPNNPELVIKALVDKQGNVIKTVGAAYSRFNQKTSINVDTAGEGEFVKQLGKNDANTVTDAMKTRTDAINSLKNLDRLAVLNNDQLISGSFATGRVGATNLLQTLGLANEADAKRLSSSEQFQKTSKDLILQTLGGKLGAGFSNEDRKFIESLVPSLENSPDARRKLIEFMQKKFTNIVDEVNSLETYARNKKGLGGYTYKTPLPTTAPSAPSQYTPEDRDKAKKILESRGVKVNG
jgi:hypothetical protein